MKQFLISLGILFIGLSFTNDKPKKLKPTTGYHIDVKEPSDICRNPKNDNYFVVSDNGFLHEMNIEGKILRTADFEGYDCEGVYAEGDLVYVVEEMVRKIRVFDNASLELIRTVTIPYFGGRNKAYECITYNPEREVYIIITEKDPIILFELDASLNTVNEIRLGKIARDISGATYHNNALWLLSDEDRQVIKVNPSNYEVQDRWVVPIVNPEGIAFTKEGDLLLVSDDMEKLYSFNKPFENAK